MRLLVLGGTAWLGSLIVAGAVARGHEVTALARGESGDLPAGAAFVRADRAVPGAFDEVTGEWDAVIDVTRQPGQLRAAVEALADRVAHWVFVSSGSAYRDASIVGGDESMALHDPLDHDVMASMEEYGAAKAACERILLDALERRLEESKSKAKPEHKPDHPKPKASSVIRKLDLTLKLDDHKEAARTALRG